MLVAIMPPPALQKTLTRIRGIEIRQPMSVADAHRSLRLAETRLVILDPAGLREDIFEAFLDCIVASGASLVLYGSLGSVFCARSVRAAKTMSIEIILSGGEDEFAVLTRMIRAIGSPTATSLLMSAFADRLTPGGDILAVGIISLFTDQASGGSAAQFAKRLSVDPSTIRTRLRSRGLRSPERLINCIRVARAYSVMSSSQALSVAQTAARLGWPSRTMRSQFQQLLSQSPRESVRDLSAKVVSTRLFEAAIRGQYPRSDVNSL
jgi:AraC-like DNA-binding protein